MNAASFRALLEERLLLLDAALGTELSRRGAPSAPPLWSARAVLETPALRKIPGNAQMIERVLAVHPAGRLTTPEDVANVIVAVARPETAWLTGNVLGVDGTEDLIG